MTHLEYRVDAVIAFKAKVERSARGAVAAPAVLAAKIALDVSAQRYPVGRRCAVKFDDIHRSKWSWDVESVAYRSIRQSMWVDFQEVASS